MSYNSNGPSAGLVVGWIVGIVVVILAIMAGYPQYNVYSQRLQGAALLAHAQSAKEVAVAEAKAKMESASLLAQAEVERAKGVAQANEIIGKSLQGNESYLHYLWITEVAGRGTTKEMIYVPTGSILPNFLEAGRGVAEGPPRR